MTKAEVIDFVAEQLKLADPQLSGVRTRAARLVDELEDRGYLRFGDVLDVADRVVVALERQAEAFESVAGFIGGRFA